MATQKRILIAKKAHCPKCSETLIRETHYLIPRWWKIRPQIEYKCTKCGYTGIVDDTKLSKNQQRRLRHQIGVGPGGRNG
jgi:predicted RNA-binding Zn-ribbon protein involved in translation (DUF1610 family)